MESEKKRTRISQFSTVPDGRDYVILYVLDEDGAVWASRVKNTDVAFNPEGVIPGWKQIHGPGDEVEEGETDEE